MKTIFVSSTFKDFQRERDVLRDNVLPQINLVAKKYGETIEFCDLRWGIDTSKLDSVETAQKVLTVCLDEIDRCSPPMIVILGYRYGWIPDCKEIISSECQSRCLDLDDLDISVTALEIEYGALSSEKKRKNTLFYFREIDDAPVSFFENDEASLKKLTNLKERIYALSGGMVKTYRVVWNDEQEYELNDFIQTVRNDILNSFLPQWEESMNSSPLEKLVHSQIETIRDKASRWFFRDSLASLSCRALEESNYLILKGESGSGKSMLFSKIVAQYIESGWFVVPVICGSGSTSTAFDVLTMILNTLEELIGKEKSLNYNKQEKSQCITALYDLCERIKKDGKKVLIAIDAVDQLLDNEDRRGLIFFPKNLNDTVKLIMTVQSHINLYDLKSIEITKLSVEEKRDFVYGYSRCFRKELNPIVIETIIKKGEIGSPLYLSLLLQRLTMMNRLDFVEIAQNGDSIAAITKKQIDIINNTPSSLEQLCTVLFNEAGQRINPYLSKEVLKYIAVSRLGLRICDLQVLIGEGWNYLDFSLLISYLNDSFIIRKDGRVDFSHLAIKSSVAKQYNDSEKAVMHKSIFDYLETLDDDDEIRMKEIGFHCIKCGDCEAFFSLIKRGFSKDRIFLKILAKDTYLEYLPTLPSFREYLSAFKNTFSRLFHLSFWGFSAGNNIVNKTALVLSDKGTSNMCILGNFVVNYVLPQFNSFSPIEVYGKFHLLNVFYPIFQDALDDSEESNILAFQISLAEGDIYFNFSNIADLHEHDDNKESNRRKAIAFYQKRGLYYLTKLKNQTAQEQYLLYASSYHQRMEEASIFASEKDRYLGYFLENIQQLSQPTIQQQLEVVFGYARRAYYAAFSNSIFTQNHINRFEESFRLIDCHISSPENMLKLLLHYYYLIMACYIIKSERVITYLSKSMNVIDEIILIGLSPHLLFEYVREFVMTVELILTFSNNEADLVWIKNRASDIFDVIKNLYHIEPLLDLAKNAVLLQYDLLSRNIKIEDNYIELYKSHIVDMATLNSDAYQFILYCEKNGYCELKNMLEDK